MLIQPDSFEDYGSILCGQSLDFCSSCYFHDQTWVMRPRQEFLHVQHQETLLFFPPSNYFGPKLCIRTRSVGFLDARIAIPCQASRSPLRNKDLLGTSSYLVPPPPRLLLIWAVGFFLNSLSVFRRLPFADTLQAGRCRQTQRSLCGLGATARPCIL